MIQLIPPKPYQQQHSRRSKQADSGQLAPVEQSTVERLDGRSPISDRGRVVVFIDGASLFYAAMQMEIEIDYTRLLDRLLSGGRLIHAHFYTGVDTANEKQKGFLYWMQCNGYRVVAKDLQQSTAGSHSKKVSLNVEIAVDMVRLAPYCDTMILVSGDGDLTCALDFVTYQGVQTEIVGLRSMISEQLINVADFYTDLAMIRQEIQKRSSAPVSLHK
jgi:uncharacterized LabA/DUF88 family protein